MNKILFLTRYPLSQQFNLKAKFDGQIDAFEKLGLEVLHFGYDDHHYYLINGDSRQPVCKVFGTRTFAFHHFFSYMMLFVSVIRVMRKSCFGEGDYVYMRHMPSELFAHRMKRMMKKKGLTIIEEIPTYIVGGKEKPRLIIRIFKFLFKIFGKDNFADFYTLIGDPSDGTFNGKPALNIDNGVNVDGYNSRTPVLHDGINLIAVASVAYWHGFDRVVEGMHQYTGDEKVHFTVVGPDGDGSLEKIKSLVANYGLENSVSFAGPKFGVELDNLVENSDLAVASLGLFRKKITSASALKNREYMSRGIPFVFASNDPVLDENPSPYTLRIANDESPVDIEKLIEFIKSLPDSDVVIKDMREYAYAHMTWQAQFKKVFNFIHNPNNQD